MLLRVCLGAVIARRRGSLQNATPDWAQGARARRATRPMSHTGTNIPLAHAAAMARGSRAAAALALLLGTAACALAVPGRVAVGPRRPRPEHDVHAAIVGGVEAPVNRCVCCAARGGPPRRPRHAESSAGRRAYLPAGTWPPARRAPHNNPPTPHPYRLTPPPLPPPSG